MYIKLIVHYGLLYKRGEEYKLVGYNNTNYIEDYDICRLTTGYVFRLDSRAIFGIARDNQRYHYRKNRDLKLGNGDVSF